MQMAAATSAIALFITQPWSAAPPRTGTQCWVMSTSALFWGVGRGTCSITSWLDQEGKLNAMNLLIIKNSNSQEKSSPLVAVSSDYKTLGGCSSGWVRFISIPWTHQVLLFVILWDLEMLGDLHRSPAVGKDHTGLIPYTAPWQSWG